ncbi:MAG: phage/plasmid primase, P4 family [Candidatus Marinimicrobia bacterium]|nr:phage/plasmid primase, P4 family [Candidatus Neomarinimicrobiota bacterium]
MNVQMTSSSQFKDLNEFLAKHSAKNEQKVGEVSSSTHTRIPDKDHNIYAGSYIIPTNELQLFYGLYYESIFVQKRKEYLTERQLENGGPMAVDFDFRYNHDVTARPHTAEHICDMVCEYSEQLKGCYIIEPDKPFSVFIFEKPHVNRLADGSLTKDGIHMIIGMQIDHCMQTLIREKMIEQLAEVWQDLPLINTWDSVLDEGISKGKTNWQLFGSRKPGNEAYELTHHYIMTVDPTDGEFKMDEEDVSKFDLKNSFEKLSVQYDKHPKFELNPKIVDEYNKKLGNKASKIKKASSKIKMNLLVDNEDESFGEDYISLNDIKDKGTLERAVTQMINGLLSNEYELKETHDFTQALPSKYYDPGSHLLNRQVAFALKHTDDRLFLSWVQLRSKAADFDYNSIPELHALWKKFTRANQDGAKVTRKSIMYWLRKDNQPEYEKIKHSTAEFYLEKAYETATEYDVAMVLKQLYKDRYVCVSYDKKGIWYQFRNHRWVTDKGLSLRSKISEELYVLLASKVERLQKEMFEYQDDDDRKAFLQKKMKVIVDLSIKLKRTNDKNNIMREAAEIFYDAEFVRNMDTNKYLMCFNNGVVDFMNKEFREGYPEDYITKTTKINYIPYDTSNAEFNVTVGEIETFMSKLFPVPDLNRYMRDHLASCLIGANKNQTFNVYHGSGSNGKSIMADLMSVTLGEYKGTVPITLVTDVRGKIGGTSDEVLKLKGVRYAVMQEPSKGVKLNEGIMKELTGGDPIQARGLYSESEIFEPQFNLVVCTNNLFDIESNDDGTWRRIRKCDFMSKFIDEGESYTDNTPYIYPKDKSLKDKLPALAPVFASMLVKRAFETGGIVENCVTVENASNKYRRGQDHIAAFVGEMIIQTENPSKYVNKSGLNSAFKKWYEETQGSRKAPKAEELHEYMNKKFGQPKLKGWYGVQFFEPDEDTNVLEDI